MQPSVIRWRENNPMPDLRALSPTIVAQLQHREQPTSAERARYRGRIRKQVSLCTNCELHKSSTPIPFGGHPRARFITLGECPTEHEEKRGRPFRGAPSMLLRALMRDVGIDAEDDVHWCNVASCVPRTGEQLRTPKAEEVMACRPNMLDQLEAAYLPFVLIVGGRALKSFRSDLTAQDHHGQVFVWMDKYVVMPILHPAEKSHRVQIREDLSKWHNIVYGSDDPLGWLGETCFKCRMDATMWDRDGVPMCEGHWKKFGKTWEKERRRWTQGAVVQLTL